MRLDRRENRRGTSSRHSPAHVTPVAAVFQHTDSPICHVKWCEGGFTQNGGSSEVPASIIDSIARAS